MKSLKSLPGRSLGLMTHLIAGYPSFEDNWRMLELMEEAGVSIVEIQFPFSEPVADGPLFAMANQESLDAGTTIDDCFHLMERAAKTFSFPILMMGYYNTVYCRGEEKFVQDLAKAGGAGMIIPDLPLEEATPLRTLANQAGTPLVQLAAPTCSKERLLKIAQIANEDDSLVYAVARKGVTGKQTSMDSSILDYLDILHENLKVPFAVGFGFSSKSDLDLLEGHANLAVIGSAVLRHWKSGGEEEVRQFFKSLAV